MNKKTLLALIISAIVGAMSQAHGQEPHEQPIDGDITTRNLPCLSMQDVKNTDTPIDLTNSAMRCVTEGNYDEAVSLYAVAAAYTHFDIARVRDKSVGDMNTVLTLRMSSSMSETQRKKWDETLHAIFDHPSAQQQTICVQAHRLGPPGYYPSYMLAHGMSAFLGDTSPDEALKAGFNANSTWEDISKNYLKCNS